MEKIGSSIKKIILSPTSPTFNYRGRKDRIRSLLGVFIQKLSRRKVFLSVLVCSSLIMFIAAYLLLTYIQNNQTGQLRQQRKTEYHLSLYEHLAEQTTLLSLAARNTFTPAQDFESITEALENNTNSIAELILGNRDEKTKLEFIQLWKDYQRSFLEYTTESTKGKDKDLGKPLSMMTKFPGQITAFFGRLKVTSPQEKIRQLFNDYVAIMKTVADSYAVKDFSTSLKNQQKANDILRQLSDIIVNDVLDNTYEKK